jgi:hypothetical protein
MCCAWQRRWLLAKNVRDLMSEYYEWRANNLTSESWANELKEEIDKIGLTYIWQIQNRIP